MKTEFIIAWSLALSFSLPAISKANLQFNELNLLQSEIPVIDSMPGEPTEPNSTWTTFGEDGSIQFSSETMNLITDPAYRAEIYPAKYDLNQVPDLLVNNKVAFALWTLINTYLASPDSARTIAFVLANHGLHGELYLNAFYTYAFADPEIFHFTGGESVSLEYPKLLDEKLQSCRALAAYTDKFLEVRSGRK